MAAEGLGNFIRRRRGSMGLSQEELGHLVDKSQSQIAAWENTLVVGKLPSREVLTRMAPALNTTMEELLQVAGYLESGEKADDVDDVRAYTAMMHNLQALDVPDRLKDHIRATIQMARELSRKDRG